MKINSRKNIGENGPSESWPFPEPGWQQEDFFEESLEEVLRRTTDDVIVDQTWIQTDD